MINLSSLSCICALESERVRVAVRLRPRNSQDLCDADYADCVELQPEVYISFYKNMKNYPILVIPLFTCLTFQYMALALWFCITQLKRLKLRKNNWSSESYRFDEVFTETTSQNRVYDVVAKPVVEVIKYKRQYNRATFLHIDERNNSDADCADMYIV